MYGWCQEVRRGYVGGSSISSSKSTVCLIVITRSFIRSGREQSRIVSSTPDHGFPRDALELLDEKQVEEQQRRDICHQFEESPTKLSNSDGPIPPEMASTYTLIDSFGKRRPRFVAGGQRHIVVLKEDVQRDGPDRLKVGRLE